MAYLLKNIRSKIFEILPLILMFFISLNGSSVIDFKFFSINILYILIYFWVLRMPQTLGYGFIFISGIINDVVFGLPLGASTLSLLRIVMAILNPSFLSKRISLIKDIIQVFSQKSIADVLV